MSEKSEKDQKAFQSYLDNIQAKTGKSPEDFRLMAAEKGLAKNGEIVTWLKADFGLGHGHANAIAHVIQSQDQAPVSDDDAVAAHFTGKKAQWRPTYDALLAQIATFGAMEAAPAKSYISLVRGSKKFAIVQPTAERLDIGIKLKGAMPTERLEAAGTWNSMVTHRVRLSDPQQLDAEVLAWLQQAYNVA